MSNVIDRTEVVDILSKMQFFQGQSAGRKLWFDKPIEVQEEDCEDFTRDIRTIRDYILQLEEARHSGEWIPCSERLPELTEGSEYFKQSPCCLVAVKWWDGDITESVGWYNENGMWSDDGRICKVIAWQPLPQPYREKVE